ncbi:MAG: protein translocase subunit SecD [Acidimicrobiales bacterium]
MRRGLVWSLLGIIIVAVAAVAGTVAAGHTILLGLDLRGGVSVVLQPQGKASSSTLQESVTIIERRVNGLGVANSSVARQGNDIVINLPGIKDSQGALKVLGETATLFFRPVLCTIPPYAGAAGNSTPTTTPCGAASTSGKTALGAPAGDMSLAAASFPAAGSPAAGLSTSGPPAAGVPTATTTPPATAPPATTIVPSQSPSGGTPVPANAAPSQADCSASNAAQIPSTPVGRDVANSTVILPYYDQSVRYVLGPADLKGDVVADTHVVAPTSGGGYQVQVNFTSSGGAKFDQIAGVRYQYYKQNPSNPPFQSLEAIELDGVVQSAPTIQAPSFNGTAVISGSSAAPFTLKQAQNLALVLKYGSLPVRFVPQSVQTVSATIGKDSLKAGLLAGLGGIVIVMLYMIVYYRALGLVVLVGLGVGAALLYSILAELSQTANLTLTLAGVVGIIVSIGITVDSYVVYFERLKDEIRAGRTVRQSVERGFARAFRTVLTADLVSFLAALVLYLLTIGDVRGFAFTLGLSTLLDVFTAYFFIRPAVILVGRRRAFTEARVIGIGRGLGVGTVGEQ